jgi:anti-sigma factor RsiW
MAITLIKMYDLLSDTDLPLALFVNDYIDNRLDATERSALEDCLERDYDLFVSVQKSKMGKTALGKAFKVKAADNFEDKLARRIKREKNLDT